MMKTWSYQHAHHQNCPFLAPFDGAWTGWYEWLAPQVWGLTVSTICHLWKVAVELHGGLTLPRNPQIQPTTKFKGSRKTLS